MISIDRLAALFGYVPAGSRMSPPSKPTLHLTMHGRYDFTRAASGTVKFQYKNGMLSYYAVGQPDWMPVSLAAMMLSNDQEDALRLMEQTVCTDLRLGRESPIYWSWLTANVNVFELLQDRDRLVLAEPMTAASRIADEQCAELFVYLTPGALSYEYRRLFRNQYPHLGERYIYGGHAHALFKLNPTQRAAWQSAQRAFEQLNGWVENWFEFRQFEVDRTLHLVRIPAYEPLYHVAEVRSSLSATPEPATARPAARPIVPALPIHRLSLPHSR